MNVVTEAMKGESKKQSSYGVRIGLLPATLTVSIRATVPSFLSKCCLSALPVALPVGGAPAKSPSEEVRLFSPLFLPLPE